jgi:type IV secretory pathway TraG/TraD family ATPase VirD4
MDWRFALAVLVASLGIVLALPAYTWPQASLLTLAWGWLVAAILLLLCSWRLPFYPASLYKWGLVALILPWPFLWTGDFLGAPLAVRRVYLLALVFIPVLILLGTLKAMGVKPAWTALGAQAQHVCRRYPALAWMLACLPLWQMGDARGGWFWFIGIGGVVVGLIMAQMKGRPTVKKEVIDTLQSPDTTASVHAACAEPGGVFAGALAGTDLHIRTEDRASVIGPPGSGKTAFLVSQLLEWAPSQRPFICLDVKPELYGIGRQPLEAHGYTLLTYNPTAGTGQRYNLLADVHSPEAIGELTAVLVPSPASDEAVFNESARDLLDAVITHLRATRHAPTLPDVRDFLGHFKNHQGLMRTLSQSPDPDVVDLARGLTLVGQNPRLLGSIFATLRANLRFLRYPAVRDSLSAAEFRLSDLCQGQPVGLFLQFEEAHQQTTALLFAALVAHTLRYFIEHTRRPPVLLLLDEMGTVPPVPGLTHKLNTIRSRHLPTWLYWQSLEQMQGYGAKWGEGPNLILGACDLQMFFRLNDNASAKWVSEKIGTVDRVVQSVALTQGRDWIPKETRSAQLRTEPVMRPHELQQLPAGAVVASYHGLVWRGEAPAYFERWPEMAGQRPAPAEGVGPPYEPMGRDVTSPGKTLSRRHHEPRPG